ncbi:MAG: hypothetical protein QOK05_1463 [Chloroflexota bacterium]|jgi:hypothetical protein|nr:hypothetical protein [Chloroflexota bacterium]
MPRLILRDFTYLNRDLVQRFLGQLEEGLTQDAQTTTTRGGSKGAGGGVTAGPMTGRVDLRKTAGHEVSQTVSQTPASEFARLHRLMTEADGIQPLAAMDDGIWGQIQKNEVVELEVVVEVAGMAKATQFLRTAERLAPVLRAFGAADESQLDQVKMWGSALGSADNNKLPLAATLAGARRFHFFSELDVSHLLIDADAMDGEMTLLGMVQRKFAPTEQFAIPGGFPGIEMVPRAQRRKLVRGAKPEGDAAGVVGPIVVKGPGGIITPIALYR